MIERAFAVVCFFAATTALAQSERWYLPPQRVDFGRIPVTVATVPDSFMQFTSTESVFDHGGRLIFSAHQESTRIAIYNDLQQLVDTIDGALEEQFAVVAVPGRCDRYFIVYFKLVQPDTVGLFYATYDTWAPGQLAPRIVQRDQPLNLYDVNRWSAAMAVGPMRADGTRPLYVVSRASLDRFVMTADEILFDAVLVDASTPGIESFDDFHSRQIALTTDGSQLAWGDLGATHVLDLTAPDIASTLRVFRHGAKADHPFAVGGLAFSPDGRKLFVTLSDEPTPPTRLDLEIGYFATSDPAPGVFTRISDDDDHHGDMQLGLDGHIYVAGYAGLGRIKDPDSETPAFEPNAIPLSHYTLDRGRLPNQIAGELQAACTSPCGNGAVAQGPNGVRGNFELLVPYPGGGIAHYWRDNDAPDTPWRGPTVFGAALGQVDALAMLDLGGGWLEVVARAGTRLAAFRYIPPFGAWLSGGAIATGVSGTPALAGTSLVTPLHSGGIAHYVQDGGSWKLQGTFATQHAVSDVSMVAGDDAGELELVMRVDDRLAYASYGNQQWSVPETFATGVSGTPALVRGSFDGYLDLVAPLAQGGLAHYSRVSVFIFQWFLFTPIEFWLPPATFGSGTVSSVSAMRTNYNGDLEVVAHGARCGVGHYWRQSSPYAWNGPNPIRRDE